MTDFIQLDEGFTVSKQLEVADIHRLKALGVKKIIINRPDEEEPGQPSTAHLKELAEAEGISWASIPVVAGQFTPDAMEAMASALATAEGPVHAFCKSGTRSCFLWGFAQVMTGHQSAGEIVAKAAAAGYDLKPAEPMLEKLSHHAVSG